MVIKQLPALLLGAFVALCAHTALSQTCDSTRLIDVCALDSPAKWELQTPTQPLRDIGLQIISQRYIGGDNKKAKAVEYLVSSPDSTGGAFTLVSGGSEQLTVILTYNNFDGASAPIMAAGEQTTPFAGTTAFLNASIAVALADTTALPPPGSYAGSFQLDLSQTTGCGNDCAATRILLELEITVPASIRISGLEDMPISYPATSAKQEFCVYTTQGVQFGIRADSLHGSGSYVLLGTGGSGDTVSYQASAGQTGGALSELTEEVSTLNEGLTWPGSSSENCATGGENMQLIIAVSAGDLDDAMETSYKDTLTLTVETQ